MVFSSSFVWLLLLFLFVFTVVVKSQNPTYTSALRAVAASL